VIDDALHDKAKKKGKSQDKGFVWMLIMTLSFFIGVPCACFMCYGVAITIAHDMGPFDPEEIAQTCRALGLPPDSAFCRADGPQNTDELQAIIEQTYPVGITTRGDLEERFTATLSYSSETECCDVNLPINAVSVRIRFNEAGDVLSYDINDDRGAGPW
jgi:hypothetical protein